MSVIDVGRRARDPVSASMGSTSRSEVRTPPRERLPIVGAPDGVAPAEALRSPREGPSAGGRAIKGALDVVGAAVALILLAPLLAGLAVLIALVDGRPVIFRQARAGRDGRPFQIVKFRTMTRGADAQREAMRAFNEVAGGASFKMTDDPRVTRLGRILRRASLDELPQLWNVLVGEMSLVGPRPHPFDDVAGYKAWHLERLTVKPGLTGLWQISSRSDPDFDRWVQLDLEYIRDWSLARDLRILALTIPAVLKATGR